MSEQVLCILTSLAWKLCPTAFVREIPPHVEKTIVDNHYFREREEAEQNFNYKQVIPYILVLCDINKPTLYLLAQRTSQQQEKRLHNKYSLGQGGHINDLDFSGNESPILNGLKREITEEYTLTGITSCVPVGMINDNSTEVGSVHLGLVYAMRVEALNFKVAEEGKHTAQWATKVELPEYYDRMEAWSKILFDHLIK